MGSMVRDDEDSRRTDGRAAIAEARLAFAGWSVLEPAKRAGLLRQAAAALRQRDRDLAALNHRETGKLFDDALGGVQAGIDTLVQYAELGPTHRGHRLLGANRAIDYTIAEPRGVVVALTPWNDPVAIAAGLIGAALVTGNTVIHKPSERCPELGELFGQILAQVLPAEVLITLSGDARVGAELVNAAGVDVIAHVGSTATGRAITEAAVRTGAHVICENGGNDALIVDAGVDIGWAAGQAALGAYANCGQICTSVERIFVHREVAEPFTEALIGEANRLNANHRLGPLVDRRLRDVVHQQVTEAVADGASAAAGGYLVPGPGSYYPATVLVGCEPAMRVMREETFGPVAPLHVIDSFADGVELANRDDYGLAATVLTPSMANAQRAIAALAVGTVKVNAVFGGAPGGSAQPRKASGHCFGYGPELLDEMTTTKVVHIAGPAR